MKYLAEVAGVLVGLSIVVRILMLAIRSVGVAVAIEPYLEQLGLTWLEEVIDDLLREAVRIIS